VAMESTCWYKCLKWGPWNQRVHGISQLLCRLQLVYTIGYQLVGWLGPAWRGRQNRIAVCGYAICHWSNEKLTGFWRIYQLQGNPSGPEAPCQSLVLAWSFEMTTAGFSDGESVKINRSLSSTYRRPERARVATVMALVMVEVWP